MKPGLNNWLQHLNSDAADEYKALRRFLQRNSSFGLFFVQCSPETGSNIINQVKEDITSKKIEVLRFEQEISSLYGEITAIPNFQDIDILFISGLEVSLIEYEKYTFNYNQPNSEIDVKEGLELNPKEVPRFLGYLNLQRDRFQKDFAISFIFIIPFFGMDYFMQRAPDFFDWRSGIFRFVPEKDYAINLDFEDYFQQHKNHLCSELLDTKPLAKELELDPEELLQALNKQVALEFKCAHYQEAIACYDKRLAINPNDKMAWFLRGFVLGQLERYEAAIDSYDKGLEINPNQDTAWFYRGHALERLERYEEAIDSYDKCLAINLNQDTAWFYRGHALERLERYEEAIDSYHECSAINPNQDTAWYACGYALERLARYEEAIDSYHQCLAINPNQDTAWYGCAFCLVLLNQTELAIESLTKAIAINPEWLESAKTDSDFDRIRNDKRFQSLVNSPSQLSQ